MFLINSRQSVFSCGPSCPGQALSRNYGRCFAEFLNEGSLVHLRLLASPTCVGFSTVTYILTLEVFLGNSLIGIDSTCASSSANHLTDAARIYQSCVLRSATYIPLNTLQIKNHVSPSENISSAGILTSSSIGYARTTRASS